MQQYRCIIVEDEPLAAEVVQDYIRQVPFLHLVSVCSDALYALDILQKEKIDLIFLDINLPKLKGLDFLKTLKHPPGVIITTAYHEYALQGYEYNVIDYLLKPIEFSRFLTAVNKIRQAYPSEPARIQSFPQERTFLFFNVGKKKLKLYVDEILYIESLKEYIRVYTRSRNILTKFQLGEIEAVLNKNLFLRVHRSYIVAKDKIDAFTATDIEINGKQIPVGRSYKELVQSVLEQHSG